jgi:hypothetical protein
LPLLRAKSAMITSVTLPNVAFNNPPTGIDEGNYIISKLQVD